MPGTLARRRLAQGRRPGLSGGQAHGDEAGAHDHRPCRPGSAGGIHLTKQEQRGDETWCVAAAPFASIDDLQKVYADMSGVTVQQLDIKDGKFTYDVSLDLSQEGTSPAPVQATWQLTVPGAVGTNNADKVDGSTLTWNLTPGKSVEIKAESGLGGLSLPFSVPRWLYAVVGGCLCLAVFAWPMRGRVRASRRL